MNSAPIFEASIVCPVFNRVEYTRDCLISVEKHTADLKYEAIIIDNASTDSTPDFLKNLSGAVMVITNKFNLGFAKACNQGARFARGRFLVFLNNDTLAGPGWLSAMLAAHQRIGGVGIVGSKLIYPGNGLIQHAGVVFNYQGIPYHIYQGLRFDHPAVNQLEEFQAVTGACLLIDRELFFKAGGFDEGFVNGYEDLDLCLKVRRMGFKVIYTPHSVLIHAESMSPGRKDHELENRGLFFERWGGKIQPDEDEHYARHGHCIKYQPGGQKFTVYEIN